MPDRDREFREFFEAEFRPLRRLAFLLTADWGEAEDLAQETMVRVYRSWSRIRERDKPAAYARTVLVNRHRSMLRRAKVEAKHLMHRASFETVVPEMDETHLVVWKALGDLPLRERRALVLRFYEDMSLADVAAALEIPIGTVKSLTHRALAHLREQLGPELVESLAGIDE